MSTKTLQSDIHCNWEGILTNEIHMPETIICLSCTTDGKLIACGDDQGLIHVINPEMGIVQKLVGHKKWVNNIDISSDNQMIISGSLDLTIRMWDANTGQQIQLIQTRISDVIRFSPNRLYIASGGFHDSITIWNISEQQIQSNTIKCGGPVWSIDYSADNRYLLESHGFYGSITIWHSTTGKLAYEFHEYINLVAHCVRFSQSGKIFAQESHDFNIIIRDIRRRKTIVCLRGHKNSIYSLSFSQDGQYLVSGSKDCSLRLWNLMTRNHGIIKEYFDIVTSVGFSPDNKYIASASGKTIDIHLAKLHSI